MDDQLQAIERYWSQQANTFDREPDHGLADAQVRAAWDQRLEEWLPEPPARVADLGCGTGSLSVLLAQAGHEIKGIDLSPAMIKIARKKATKSRVSIEFEVGDAAGPDLPVDSFDVILGRHVLWALPDPEKALANWAGLLRPNGRLVLIEGRWFSPEPETTGYPWYGGVTAKQLNAFLRKLSFATTVHQLSDDSTLWGKEVTDERYVIIAHPPKADVRSLQSEVANVSEANEA